MKKCWRAVGAIAVMAAMSVTSAGAVAQYDPVDPTNPYIPPVSGMFHEQKITVDGASGCYSVYIPANFESGSDGIMILTPDGMTAKTFVESEEGQAWKAVSDQFGVTTVYIEPENGQTWNLDLAADKRDDQVFLKEIYNAIHKKAQTNDAAVNVSGSYVVGYEEGGTAAHEFAMEWTTVLAGAASIGGSAVPDSVIETLGDALSYPFAQASDYQGQEENAIANSDVPLPVWIVESEDETYNSDTVESYWVSANDAVKTAANNYAQATYTNLQNAEHRVWVTGNDLADQITPEVVYDAFLSEVQRFVGDPCGRLEWTVEHVNDGKSGFFIHEEMVDGKLRRWMDYVPSSYTGNKDVPLVVAIHGYTDSMYKFTSTSRWQDVAEENGFIVVFAQGYPTDGVFGNIPLPYWNNPLMGITVDDPVDELSYFRHVLEKTKDTYSIDEARVYASGHSNGSCMTWYLALEESDLFTAFAPVGSNMGARYEDMMLNEVAVPVWLMKSEYDIEDGASLKEGTLSYDTLEYWTYVNGTNNTAVVTTDSTGRFVSRSYLDDDGVPLVRFTEVKNCPHAYIPEQAEMIWNDFFSKYSKKDGVLYYENKPVASPEAGNSTSFADIQNHWAKEAIEYGVEQGWFNGTSSNAFSPELVVDRAMAVTVLGRSAGVNGDASAATSFTDLDTNGYYTPYVGWALENGITNGTSQTTFGPTEDLTREQLAVMLSAYLEVQGKTLVLDSDSMLSYTDDALISSWAKSAVAQMQGAGIMTGKENNCFDPQGSVTRAELATVMQRIVTM